jgi:hypothetical protein
MHNEGRCRSLTSKIKSTKPLKEGRVNTSRIKTVNQQLLPANSGKTSHKGCSISSLEFLELTAISQPTQDLTRKKDQKKKLQNNCNSKTSP